MCVNLEEVVRVLEILGGERRQNEERHKEEFPEHALRSAGSPLDELGDDEDEKKDDCPDERPEPQWNRQRHAGLQEHRSAGMLLQGEGPMKSGAVVAGGGGVVGGWFGGEVQGIAKRGIAEHHGVVTDRRW